MKLRILLFLAGSVLLYMGLVLAHPPNKIELEVDYSTKIIKVIVIHTVRDSLIHYVDAINIELNEENIIKQIFLSQLTKENQKGIYLIGDFKPEDKITVTANCNRYGKKKRSIIY